MREEQKQLKKLEERKETFVAPAEEGMCTTDAIPPFFLLFVGLPCREGPYGDFFIHLPPLLP